MAKGRDYKAEYERRIAKGTASGHSRSQARGHAKASETLIKAPRLTLSDERVQAALRALRQEKSISAAARSIKVSPERLRKIAIERSIIEKQGRRWQVKAALPRRMPLFSKGHAIAITVGGAGEATDVGRFMSAAGSFLETNKLSFVTPFDGQGVRDAAGKFHPFETRPNVLYRLAASGEGSFEQIYRIII